MKKPPPGVRIVEVKSKFQKQAARADGLAEKDALTAADTVIEGMEEAYLDELAADIKALETLAGRFVKTSAADALDELADEIYLTVKRIRDLGETFGYILVTEIGDLFCELIHRQKFTGKYVVMECLACIETLKLVSRQTFRGKTVEDAAEICAGIAKIVDKYPKVDKAV
jgi:hypothetical protein